MQKKSDKIIFNERNQISDIFTGTEIISNATKSYNPLNDIRYPHALNYILA